ncbi:MAG: signal recognition particle-docking protein FtsY [Succinivibrio sp.]
MGIFSVFSKKNKEDRSEKAELERAEAKSEELVQKDTDSEQSEKEVQAAIKPETEKVSFFERLKKTRENLSLGISALVVGKKIDDDLYEDLETALLTADLGVETTLSVIERLKKESKLRDLKDAGALRNNLKAILKEILKPCQVPFNPARNGDLPFVILMVGVNGAGKTTTIGKLAMKYKARGMKVMLAAGDTFRAAAVEQLKEWGQRTDTPVIAQPTGSDSASVIFDALTSAKAHGYDVLICDTAGRLQNKDNLMEELRKIVRVMKKIDESVPNEVMLVLDSTTGQNAVSQMKIFGDTVNVSGLCLTKLDGTAKGGVVFSLADRFKVPVRYVGIGEKVEDLREFDIDSFVEALFG